jgi:hypothetical protein
MGDPLHVRSASRIKAKWTVGPEGIGGSIG